MNDIKVFVTFFLVFLLSCSEGEISYSYLGCTWNIRGGVDRGDAEILGIKEGGDSTFLIHFLDVKPKIESEMMNLISTTTDSNGLLIEEYRTNNNSPIEGMSSIFVSREGNSEYINIVNEDYLNILESCLL